MRATVEQTCQSCGGRMILRNGKYGKFYGCSGFPKCRNTQRFVEEIQEEDFDPSDYQRAIFQFVKDGEGHGVVDAGAGSGKTTTIVQGLKYTPPTSSVGFVAFNRYIAKALAKKAPPHVHVSTLHSLGYGNVRNALGDVKVEPRKVWHIVKDLMDGMAWDQAEKVDQSISSVVRLVSLCKAILQEPSEDTLDYIVDRWGIETNGDREIIYEVVETAFRVSIEDTSTIDYDDMIFLSVTQVPCRQFDFLFVDETQDLNQSQLEMALRSVKPGGRIVAVGDKNQSIYGFRGADTDAMPRIKETLKATVFPLSITYRCPRSHVELANTIVPELEAAEWAEDGVLDSVSEYGFLDTVKSGDLVLCRTNAPLVRPAFSLIRQGVKAVILGRDIGKGLTSLIRKLQKRHQVRSLDDTLDALVKYRRKEMGRLVRLQKEMAAQNLDDKVETIIVLTEGCRTTAELERKIDQVFSDEHEGVTFSTVHKAKGGEADRVFILRPELMPHPMATKDWEQAQEWNIMYVAYTRAKKALYFVGAMPLFTTEDQEILEELVVAEELEALEMAKQVAEAYQTFDDKHRILSEFPHPGRFEDNIYRFSAREMCDAMDGYEPHIDSGQLVLEHALNEESTIVVYTSVKVGQIAGGTGDDSIRIVRRDVTKKGTFWHKEGLYVTRRVPQGSDPMTHIADKINAKAQLLFRDCPECGLLQVKCRAGKGRDIRIWWKSDCRHGQF